MKIFTLIQAVLIAVSLAGAAQAAAPAAPPAVPAAQGAKNAAASVDAALLPAGYASNNPANGAFAEADSSDEVQPGPHAKDAAPVDAAAAPVPEPQMFLMMLIGLVLLGFASSRREVYEKFTD